MYNKNTRKSSVDKCWPRPLPLPWIKDDRPTPQTYNLPRIPHTRGFWLQVNASQLIDVILEKSSFLDVGHFNKFTGWNSELSHPARYYTDTYLVMLGNLLCGSQTAVKSHQLISRWFRNRPIASFLREFKSPTLQ